MKDNDFLNEGHKLQIGDDNKKYFLEKLKRDVEVRFEMIKYVRRSVFFKCDSRDLNIVVLCDDTTAKHYSSACFSYVFHH